MDGSPSEYEKMVGLKRYNMNKELTELPASFRVIGVGNGTVFEIIDKVKSFGFDCLSTDVVNSPAEISPSEIDQLAIIVFIDNEVTANLIARSFHQAGVLTIGFSEDADPSCFDSILKGVKPTDYPDAIKSLIQTILNPSYVSFDFHDLCTVLRDSGYFTIKRVIGQNMTDVVEKMQDKLKNVDLYKIENLTFNIFLNSESRPPIEMKEMTVFSGMLTTLPSTVNILWPIHFDEVLDEKQIGLISIISGKDLSSDN